MEGINFGTEFGALADQVTGAIGDVLPVALPVAGVLLAITVGYRVVKKFVR